MSRERGDSEAPSECQSLSGFREGREVSVGLCPATRGEVVRSYLAVLPLRSVRFGGVFWCPSQGHRSFDRLRSCLLSLPTRRRVASVFTGWCWPQPLIAKLLFDRMTEESGLMEDKNRYRHERGGLEELRNLDVSQSAGPAVVELYLACRWLK